MQVTRDDRISALWGFAEATLFFLVPDVWISAVALRRPLARAWRAALWAVGGALVGGTLMYCWGALAAGGAEHALDWVPAIAPAMIVRVAEDLQRDGYLAVLLGPLAGTPYKVYAVESGRLGMSLAGLWAITVPARLLRFALAALLASACARWPLRSWRTSRRLLLHALCWTAFYCWYFSAMDW